MSQHDIQDHSTHGIKEIPVTHSHTQYFITPRLRSSHPTMTSIASIHTSLPHLCPNLCATISQIYSQPHDAGWLLGCISNIAFCFIEALFHSKSLSHHQTSTKLQDGLDTLNAHAYQYLQDVRPIQLPFAGQYNTLIDLDELVALVRRIYIRWVIARLVGTAAPSIRVDTDAQIEKVDTLFGKTLYTAMIERLYGGGTEHDDCREFEVGWLEGKSRHANVFGLWLDLIPFACDCGDDDNADLTGGGSAVPPEEDIDVAPFTATSTTHPRPGPVPVQYQLDDTATELRPTGPPISPHHYSFPLLLTIPSSLDGDCGICLEALSLGQKGLELGLPVLARCEARHAFHNGCLGKWVNGSAMKNSNRCPLDREVICEARERE
ncbi:hypothetical protein K458DRAFT_423041 [Lentithecium fluviatile CBS 122367]|uniref:RING-type domain-containing protein n=1 Tax=Lentithecium fluviatile CBS 122367 TaxID=1168545 RepID=A0A6G1IKT4_9PLEO|nr:hypothetical protein K458DRAFT_423041 [Lentithecium fluviatile CBS 122367]